LAEKYVETLVAPLAAVQLQVAVFALFRGPVLAHVGVWPAAHTVDIVGVGAARRRGRRVEADRVIGHRPIQLHLLVGEHGGGVDLPSAAERDGAGPERADDRE